LKDIWFVRLGGSSFNIANADSRLMYMTNADIVCRSIPVLPRLSFRSRAHLGFEE